VVSIVLTTVLLFMVIPAAYTFEMLVAMLAVPFLLVGTLFTRPQFTMIAMMLTVNTATFLSLQGAYDTDFNAFFNGNVATVVGYRLRCCSACWCVPSASSWPFAACGAPAGTTWPAWRQDASWTTTRN
jgi:hypothetical protein